MDIWEQQKCLESLSVIIDTREQDTERAQKRYKSFGCGYERRKLDYGDYSYNFTFPDGRLLYDTDSVIQPDVMIERKMNLEELSNCMCQERDRFEREFKRASVQNAAIYLIVEDASLGELLRHRYDTKFNEKAFFATFVSWVGRYNIKPLFVPHELSGKVIHEILYRELKERLKGGFYG